MQYRLLNICLAMSYQFIGYLVHPQIFLKIQILLLRLFAGRMLPGRMFSGRMLPGRMLLGHFFGGGHFFSGRCFFRGSIAGIVAGHGAE